MRRSLIQHVAASKYHHLADQSKALSTSGHHLPLFSRLRRHTTSTTMQRQSSCPEYFVPNVKKQLSIIVLKTAVSAPPSPLLEHSKQSCITLQAAAPLSPPPEIDKFPVQPVNHSLDHQKPQPTSIAETEPIVAVIGVGYVGTHLVEAFASH